MNYATSYSCAPIISTTSFSNKSRVEFTKNKILIIIKLLNKEIIEEIKVIKEIIKQIQVISPHQQRLNSFIIKEWSWKMKRDFHNTCMRQKYY